MNELEIVNKPLSAKEIRANVNLIQEVMKAVMVKEVHYGTIPGTQKPTLFKAGSEKILSTFRIAVNLEVEDLSAGDAYRYRVKAIGVLPTGEIVGVGIGECSTDEEKYRWRGAVNDKEWSATAEDRKRIKYIKPTNWNKDGEVRQVRTNPADLANTALKMAKKRAQIDLTLTATAASDVFDQDIEDLPDEYREGMREPQSASGKPHVEQPRGNGQGNNHQPAGTINENQKKLLYVKLKAAGLTEDDLKKHYGIESVTDLPASKMNEALKAIADGEIKPAAQAASETKEQTLPEVCAECGEVGGHSVSCPNAEPPGGRFPGMEG